MALGWLTQFFSEGKIRVVINKDSRAFGVALDSVTVLKDAVALLPGGGGPSNSGGGGRV